MLFRSGEPSAFYLCKPPAEFTNENGSFVFEPLIKDALQTAAGGIPDEKDLLSKDAAGQPALRTLRNLRVVMRFSPLIPLGLLLLVTIFAVRGLRSWFGWWGVPFILAGILTLLAAASINPIFGVAFRRGFEPGLPAQLPLALADTVRGDRKSVV